VNTVRCGLFSDSSHHDGRRRLDEPRQVEKIVERTLTGWRHGQRAVFPRVAHSRREERLGPRLDVFGFEILRDVER
jgi:hypothetical protein